MGILRMTAAHWADVERIYREGIATGEATFESAPPDEQHFFAGKVPELSWVAVSDDRVLGWVAASPVSARAVYAGVVEHSVYVAAEARGRGVGHRLLDKLIEASEEAGIWTIQTSVFRENLPSIRLHLAVGFREVGHRSKIAQMTHGPHEGEWRDTILLERRSAIVGSA
jgi:L-amino acid N-acyltransferase YncA